MKNKINALLIVIGVIVSFFLVFYGIIFFPIYSFIIGIILIVVFFSFNLYKELIEIKENHD